MAKTLSAEAFIHAGWDSLLHAFQQFVPLPPPTHVLDVGCGSGTLARYLVKAGHRVVGIDSDPLMIDRAQELAASQPAAITFEVGRVEALRFEDKAFGAALATNVLFLLPNPLVGLREMVRVVQAGGQVAMLNPSPRLTLAAVEALTQQSGYDGPAHTSLVNWARAAETHPGFGPDEAEALFTKVGLTEITSTETLGDGLALLVCGVKR